MNGLIKCYYWLLLLPAFSVFQILFGTYVQNRLSWLPFSILLLYLSKYRKLYAFNFSVILFLIFFLFYTILANINDWDMVFYFGYLLTFVLLFITNSMVFIEKKMFLSFLIYFLLFNFLYVIFQLLCLNIGYPHLALIHTNLAAQNIYVIPVFFNEPFFRYTGVFNESSPFAFYLIITFCFFQCLNEKYLLYRNVALILLLFSGSKLAYLFLLLHVIFFTKMRIVRFLSFIVIFCLFYLFLFEMDFLLKLTSGESASLINRMMGLDNSFSSDLSYWGTGLKKSSTGEVPLDIFSILFNGFGVCGTIFIFLFIIMFYSSIRSKYKKIFILPFLLGGVSNGSLLIFQYSLLSYCLVFLHKNDSNNTVLT